MSKRRLLKLSCLFVFKALLFLFSTAWNLLAFALEAKSQTREFKTTDDLFREMYSQDPNVFDSRPPKHHQH